MSREHDDDLHGDLAALEAEAQGLFGAVRQLAPAHEERLVADMVARTMAGIGAGAPSMGRPWRPRVVGLAGLVAVIGGAAWLAGAGISRPDGHARDARPSAPIAVPSEVPTAAAIERLDAAPSPIANVSVDAVPASRSASSAPASSAPVSSPTASRPTRPTRPAKAKVAATVPDPEDLFARANAARDAGHDAEAADLYRALLAGRPEPDSANVARIDLALLYLRRLDRPADALGLFEDYLRAAPDGTLAERALVGKADALARLGRVDDERAAWQALLERWPESLQASRARRRLEHR